MWEYSLCVLETSVVADPREQRKTIFLPYSLQGVSAIRSQGGKQMRQAEKTMLFFSDLQITCETWILAKSHPNNCMQWTYF